VVVETPNRLTGSARFPWQVTVLLSAEQGRMIEQLADERQLTLVAIIREAMREYLANLPRRAASAR